MASKNKEKLTKPVAYVVLKPGNAGSAGLADELRHHVKSRLAPYKYPRWIEFIDELPKTATGKIQRYKLRQLAAGDLTSGATPGAHPQTKVEAKKQLERDSSWTPG